MTDEHLKQLGRLVVNFSSLEIHMAFIVWNMISTDQNIGKAITSNMSFSALNNLFGSLSEIHFKEENLKSDAQTIISKMGELNEKRNQVIHSFWGTNEDNPEIVTRIKFKPKGIKGLSIQEEQIGAEKIKILADDIKEGSQLLIQFINKISST